MKCKMCTTDERYRKGEWIDGVCPECQENYRRLLCRTRQEDYINNTMLAVDLPHGRKRLLGKTRLNKDLQAIENN